jgi:hypothetical protein
VSCLINLQINDAIKQNGSKLCFLESVVALSHNMLRDVRHDLPHTAPDPACLLDHDVGGRGLLPVCWTQCSQPCRKETSY